MAKPTGALLSFGASGSIAKTAVFAKWRGRQYVRQHVVPANPRTVGQVAVRTAFAWLQQVWKNAPSLLQDPWTLAASGQPVTNRNLFGKANIASLQTATDLALFTFVGGAKGGVSPAAVVVTPGSGDLVVAVTAPPLPTGWTITAAVAAAVKDQNPQMDTEYYITAGQDLTSPYSITLTGLTGGQLYRVGAWLQWMKPDGSTAYSANLLASGTPT